MTAVIRACMTDLASVVTLEDETVGASEPGQVHLRR